MVELKLKFIGIILIVLVSFIALGCMESSSPQNAVTPTPTPTSIITLTPTPIPTPTSIITPIPTPIDGGRNILILIDVSGTTTFGDSNPVAAGFINTSIEQEDNIAANIVGAMTPDSNVGVICFGGKNVVTLPFTQMITTNKNKMKQDILHITPSIEYPTDLNDALKAADDMMKNVTGTKEVIVLSDGILTSELLDDTINAAKTLTRDGITTTFIQVRTNENEFNVSYKKNYKIIADSAGARIIAAPIGYTGIGFLEQPSATSTLTP